LNWIHFVGNSLRQRKMHNRNLFKPEELMPSFNTLPPRRPPIAPGVHIANIVVAKEKISEAGNDMLILKLMLPDSRTIGSVLTFVPAAQPVINAFCDSANLRKPAEADVAVDLNSSHVLGRYVYITVSVETDTGAQPKVIRHLTRAEALAINPRLAEVALREQASLELPRTKLNPNPFHS
jgi:hypothetical protein